MATIDDGELGEVLAVKNSIKAVKSGEQSDVEPLKLKAYKRRWLMLAIYVIYTAGGTCQWIEYSIIANIIMRYYDVSPLMVDWTSMIFMAFYSIFIFPASYLSDRWGLRWTALIGSGLNCLGSWTKILSVQPDRFYVACIGQSIVAITQTTILPMPGRLAAQWFPSRELSTATSLGLFGGQLGIALGFLCTPMIVKNHESLDDIGNDLSRLSWAIAIITTVGFLLVLVLFQDEPRLPPSETRALQKINRSTKGEDFVGPIKRLFKNRSYIILCNSYGLSIGVLNVVSTLLNQIFLVHFENGEEDAGRIGLAMIITGMAGSVTFGIILDRTHKFKETAVTVYFFMLCGQILFALFTCFAMKVMIYLSATFLGFFMSGYLALGYEMCTEYTYPEPENISAGILHITNNVFGIVLVILLGMLLKEYGDIPVHVGLCLTLLLGFILTVLTKNEQRRQDARRGARREELARIGKIDVDGAPETNPLTRDTN